MPQTANNAIPRPRRRMSPLRIFGLFVSLPLTLLFLGLAFTQKRSEQVQSHQTALTEALGSVSAAAFVYAQEHDGRLPPAENWEQALQPNTGPIPLDVPPMPGAQTTRIAMNRALAGRALATLPHPEQAILFFESTGRSPNVCDDLNSLIAPTHPGPLIFGFADGRIQEVAPSARRDEVLARSAAAIAETIQAKPARPMPRSPHANTR